MFTGIVEETGTILSFDQAEEAYVLKIKAEKVLEGIAYGDSIAVNGCCLSVTQFNVETGEIQFDVLEETKRLTSLANLAQGNLVNLERSLSFNGKVGGHFVTGHIDGMGKIVSWEQKGEDHQLQIAASDDVMRYIVHKGSVAVDGISLTGASVEKESFTIWIIPLQFPTLFPI